MDNYKVTAGTVSRTIILALALVNQLLTTFGYNIIPIDDETINNLVSCAFTTAAALWAWWKNNSFTKAAIIGDAIKDDYKNQHLADMD